MIRCNPDHNGECLVCDHWISNCPYGCEAVSQKKKQVRAAFRAAVFGRDNHKCVMCDEEAVDAHHIRDRHLFENGGYVKENGISLCSRCHELAEECHAFGASAPGYSPEDLYKKIGSSEAEAIAADKRNRDV